MITVYWERSVRYSYFYYQNINLLYYYIYQCIINENCNIWRAWTWVVSLGSNGAWKAWKNLARPIGIVFIVQHWRNYRPVIRKTQLYLLFSIVVSRFLKVRSLIKKSVKICLENLIRFSCYYLFLLSFVCYYSRKEEELEATADSWILCLFFRFSLWIP